MADINGALLQDDNGNLYFIPDEKLAEFRVPDEQGQRARTDLASLDSEVSGFASPRPLAPGVTSLRAFQGPLGWQMQVSGPDNSDTMIQE